MLGFQPQLGPHMPLIVALLVHDKVSSLINRSVSESRRESTSSGGSLPGAGPSLLGTKFAVTCQIWWILLLGGKSSSERAGSPRCLRLLVNSLAVHLSDISLKLSVNTLLPLVLTDG